MFEYFEIVHLVVLEKLCLSVLILFALCRDVVQYQLQRRILGAIRGGNALAIHNACQGCVFKGGVDVQRGDDATECTVGLFAGQ